MAPAGAAIGLGRREALTMLLLAGCGPACAAPVSGRSGADALVAAYARSVGAPGRRLGPDGSVSFGESGLAYDAAAAELSGRVFVNPVLIEGAPPQELANYRRMVTALNDPAIGGMYDRAGAEFVLDETRQAYFLVRRFPVATTRPAELKAAMERMKRVAATWTVRWLYEVAMIMHGHRAPPTSRVTPP